MATLLSDNFDRANSTTVIGSPQTGPAPVVQFGVGGISGNQLYCSTATLVATYDLGTPNVELSAVGNSLSARYLTLVLGYVSSTNCYLVAFSAGVAVQLIQATPGGGPILCQSTAKMPAASGSVCKANYRDGIIRAYVDGVLVLRWHVDAPITSNLHGLRIQNVTSPTVDNLLGVDTPVITDDFPGGLQSDDLTFADVEYNSPETSVYRGRDTKIQDNAGGA
jgi:hypothetical protein